MSRFDVSDTARPESGERSDLRRQYRPIGIGAVAAALTVTAEKSEEANQSRDAGNSNERNQRRRSLAA